MTAEHWERVAADVAPAEAVIARRLRVLINSWGESIAWLRESLDGDPDDGEYACAVEDYGAMLGARSRLDRALASIGTWDSELGHRLREGLDADFIAVTEPDEHGLLSKAGLQSSPGWGGWWSDRIPQSGAVRARLEARA